jgi:predicted anti-sigma-YlaC factor YlaD
VLLFLLNNKDIIMESYDSSTQRLSANDPQVCALVQDLLPLYIEGEVSTGSRDLIVEHLARCERCAGFLAGAQSVRVQFQRQQQQRATAAERERLTPTPDQDTTMLNRVVQVCGAICLAALVALLIPVFLRAIAHMPFWFGPLFGGISLSSLWLLTGMGVLGAVGAALVLRERIAPEWKLALATTAIGIGAIGLGWKFLMYMAAVSAGIRGFMLSPYLLLGGVLVLAGAASLWQSRQEFAHTRVLALFKNASALLLASVVVFAIFGAIGFMRFSMGAPDPSVYAADPAFIQEATPTPAEQFVESSPAFPMEAAPTPAPAFVLEATPTIVPTALPPMTPTSVQAAPQSS